MALLNTQSIRCPKCDAVLPADSLNTPDLAPCPACGAGVCAAVFPALFRAMPRGQAGESLATQEQASCFYHAGKKATSACEACGRFLCALCDIEFNGRHLCPACIETGRRKGKLKDTARQRVLYDEVAAALALFPLLFWPATLLTAPATLFVVARYWRAPSSVIPRTKARFVAALLFALLQIAGWSVGVWWITRSK